jgi:hypothetical protein
MEIKIKILREHYGCWDVEHEYTSCHIPRVGEKVDFGIGGREVVEVRHDVTGKYPEVEIKVEN